MGSWGRKRKENNNFESSAYSFGLPEKYQILYSYQFKLRCLHWIKCLSFLCMYDTIVNSGLQARIEFTNKVGLVLKLYNSLNTEHRTYGYFST